MCVPQDEHVKSGLWPAYILILSAEFTDVYLRLLMEQVDAQVLICMLLAPVHVVCIHCRFLHALDSVKARIYVVHIAWQLWHEDMHHSMRSSA